MSDTLDQTDLFDWTGPPEAEEKFADFHAAHPEVWRRFEHLTLQAIERGFQHHSADAILHVVRWKTDINSGGKPFKINNNHQPYYARMFHRAHPEHAGFFRNRRSKADD